MLRKESVNVEKKEKFGFRQERKKGKKEKLYNVLKPGKNKKLTLMRQQKKRIDRV